MILIMMLWLIHDAMVIRHDSVCFMIIQDESLWFTMIYGDSGFIVIQDDSWWYGYLFHEVEDETHWQSLEALIAVWFQVGERR